MIRGTKPSISYGGPQLSHQNQMLTANYKSLTSNSNRSQQIQIAHSKFKSLTANSNRSQRITNHSQQITNRLQQIQIARSKLQIINSARRLRLSTASGETCLNIISSLYYTHIKTKQETCSVYRFFNFKNIYVSKYLRLSKFLLIKILLKRSVLILGIG